MALVRRQGLLFEESEPSLMDRVQQAGLDTPPTTPLGAQSIGATPDQAKMAGTPAHKKPVLQDTVKKTESLQATQRLDAPRQQATTTEQSAATKAQQLTQLGSLGTRVQGLIEQELKKAATTQVGQTAGAVNTAAVGQMLGLGAAQLASAQTDPNSQFSKVLAKMQQYAADPNKQTLLVELTQLGLTPAQAGQASSMLRGAGEATGAAVAQAAADTATLGALDVTQLGYTSIDELAGALGVPAADAAAMTVPQLQQRVEDLQRETFSRIQTLQAQAAGLPPGSAQRALIDRELADLGQAGVSGTEARVARTAEELQLADQVKVGGRAMSVEDALKDQNISSMIEQYILASPEQREAILPSAQFGDLRQWVDQNYQALGDLVTSAQATQEAFGQAQTDYQELNNLGGVRMSPEVLAAVIPGYQPGQVVTSEQAAAAQQALASSAVGQLAQSSVPNKATIVSALTPEVLAQANQLGWDQSKFVSAFNNAEKLRSDPLASRLLGGDGEVPAFLMDEAEWSKVGNAVAVSSAMTAAQQPQLADSQPFKDLVSSGKITGQNAAQWMQHADALGNSDVAALIGSGQVTLDNATQLLSDLPAKLQAQEASAALTKSVADADDVDELLNTIFKTPPEQLHGSYKMAQNMAELGDPEAIEIVNQYKTHLDRDGDGDIDDTDMAAIKAAVPGAPSLMNTLQNGPAGAESLLAQFSKVPVAMSPDKVALSVRLDSAKNLPSLLKNISNNMKAYGEMTPAAAMKAWDTTSRYAAEASLSEMALDSILSYDKGNLAALGGIKSFTNPESIAALDQQVKALGSSVSKLSAGPDHDQGAAALITLRTALAKLKTAAYELGAPGRKAAAEKAAADKAAADAAAKAAADARAAADAKARADAEAASLKTAKGSKAHLAAQSGNTMTDAQAKAYISNLTAK